MYQLPDHRVPKDALAATAAAPTVRFDDSAFQHQAISPQALLHRIKAELLESAEQSGQGRRSQQHG
jgi:hypothetical protein